MKKIVYFLLIAVLITTLAVGCSKNKEDENVDLSENVEANQKESEVENKEENKVEDIDYILYVKYKDKPFLYDELLTVNINDDKFKDKSIEEFVLQELIDYKSDRNLISPVPLGTKILSVERDGSTVIVDLSKEFNDSKLSSNDAMITIGSIVNTLTALPGNEKVDIKIEGELLKEYNGIEIEESMEFVEGLFPDK